MNTYYVNDEGFKNSNTFKNYLKENPSIGFLKVRAYTANEAIPVKGVIITVFKNIDDAKVVFFKGSTDESGVIEKISLPTSKAGVNNLEAPISTDYILTASYNDKERVYNISMFENIYVEQRINITPQNMMGDY